MSEFFPFQMMSDDDESTISERFYGPLGTIPKEDWNFVTRDVNCNKKRYKKLMQLKEKYKPNSKYLYILDFHTSLDKAIAKEVAYKNVTQTKDLYCQYISIQTTNDDLLSLNCSFCKYDYSNYRGFLNHLRSKHTSEIEQIYSDNKEKYEETAKIYHKIFKSVDFKTQGGITKSELEDLVKNQLLLLTNPSPMPSLLSPLPITPEATPLRTTTTEPINPVIMTPSNATQTDASISLQLLMNQDLQECADSMIIDTSNTETVCNNTTECDDSNQIEEEMDTSMPEISVIGNLTPTIDELDVSFIEQYIEDKSDGDIEDNSDDGSMGDNSDDEDIQSVKDKNIADKSKKLNDGLETINMDEIAVNESLQKPYTDNQNDELIDMTSSAVKPQRVSSKSKKLSPLERNIIKELKVNKGNKAASKQPKPMHRKDMRKFNNTIEKRNKPIARKQMKRKRSDSITSSSSSSDSDDEQSDSESEDMEIEQSDSESEYMENDDSVSKSNGVSGYEKKLKNSKKSGYEYNVRGGSKVMNKEKSGYESVVEDESETKAKTTRTKARVKPTKSKEIIMDDEEDKPKKSKKEDPPKKTRGKKKIVETKKHTNRNQRKIPKTDNLHTKLLDDEKNTYYAHHLIKSIEEEAKTPHSFMARGEAEQYNKIFQSVQATINSKNKDETKEKFNPIFKKYIQAYGKAKTSSINRFALGRVVELKIMNEFYSKKSNRANNGYSPELLVKQFNNFKKFMDDKKAAETKHEVEHYLESNVGGYEKITQWKNDLKILGKARTIDAFTAQMNVIKNRFKNVVEVQDIIKILDADDFVCDVDAKRGVLYIPNHMPKQKKTKKVEPKEKVLQNLINQLNKGSISHLKHTLGEDYKTYSEWFSEYNDVKSEINVKNNIKWFLAQISNIIDDLDNPMNPKSKLSMSQIKSHIRSFVEYTLYYKKNVKECAVELFTEGFYQNLAVAASKFLYSLHDKILFLFKLNNLKSQSPNEFHVGLLSTLFNNGRYKEKYHLHTEDVMEKNYNTHMTKKINQRKGTGKKKSKDDDVDDIKFHNFMSSERIAANLFHLRFIAQHLDMKSGGSKASLDNILKYFKNSDYRVIDLIESKCNMDVYDNLRGILYNFLYNIVINVLTDRDLLPKKSTMTNMSTQIDEPTTPIESETVIDDKQASEDESVKQPPFFMEPQDGYIENSILLRNKITWNVFKNVIFNPAYYEFGSIVNDAIHSFDTLNLKDEGDGFECVIDETPGKWHRVFAKHGNELFWDIFNNVVDNGEESDDIEKFFNNHIEAVDVDSDDMQDIQNVLDQLPTTINSYNHSSSESDSD